MKVFQNDFEMAYGDAGQGTPLLLIHGFPLNRTMWSDQVTGLSPIARIITPDLRGFGDSSATDGVYDMRLLADDCYHLLMDAGVHSPVVLCGLSMGGYIAFAFYQRFPHYVSGIILAATRAGTDTPEGKANRDRTAALVRESGPNQVVTGMLSKLMSPKTYTTHPEVVERVSRILGGATTKGIIGASLGMKDRQDFSARLDQINVPALIIHGRDDQLVPVSEAEKMDQGIPDSRLVLVPDAGHLVNLEQPDLFNQSIAHFLAELP